MASAFNWTAEGRLLEDLPPKKDGQPQYRELVTGDVKRCIAYAATMTIDGRRKLHIEQADGGRIEAAEIGEHFGDGDGAPMRLQPGNYA